MKKLTKGQLEYIEAWKKRTKKKGPFYLYGVKPLWRPDYILRELPDAKEYTVLFIDKGKVKIGKLHDGMGTRYGIETYGTLSSDKPTGLWQKSANTVDEIELEYMILVWKGECGLPHFDIDMLRNLEN